MQSMPDAVSASDVSKVLSFGPYRLDLVQHVLREGDKPLRLGSRALEILITLVEHAGEIVSKNELLSRVWPKSVVQEATLRVHIAALRKALGDDECGIRYVENFSGRGYRFVGHIERAPAPPSSVASPTEVVPSETEIEVPGPRFGNLPAPLTAMVDRAQAINTLEARIPLRRFVTIVGPGGVGKTTVALAVADKLFGAYEHGALFVDLEMVADPSRVTYALAEALGLEPVAEDPLPEILTHLRRKSVLIVLDNCEHVVGAAAGLAEKVLRAAPGVHLLATSREPLRAGSEYVHRLLPLETPVSSAMLTRAEAMTFPAIQFFVERASANLDTFDLHDSDIPFVVEICRRLDGNPLAIELAAARVDLFGVRGLAARLDDCLQLLTRGRRTAGPRHQTLRATLDWSYGLLSSLEQVILRRLAVFPGSFAIEAANALVSESGMSAADIFDSLTNLVAKSLLTVDVTGEEAMYRLLETTRVYAMERLSQSNELGKITRLHALMERNASSVPGEDNGLLPQAAVAALLGVNLEGLYFIVKN
jgi:predicted ATPase/DNA-binding winged helix-turn-helix (wHTH) protein